MEHADIRYRPRHLGRAGK